MIRKTLAAAALAAASLGAGTASAQYALRADAYFTAAAPSTGLLVLAGEARQPSWLTADTVVWLGAGGDHPGDVMVAAVRARDASGYGEGRLGRMLISTGALRPVHLDGIDLTGRAPWGTSVEVFGGMPVASSFQPRDYDWAVGGRIAQRFSRYGTLGVSYLQLRELGAVAREELGIDAAVRATEWLDAVFTSAVDLTGVDSAGSILSSLADARAALSARFRKVRVELFASQRSPSHLLPATSLFSALGDLHPSQRAGASVLLRPAPRLDVLGEGMVESVGGELGGQGLLRATLRLDDKGSGALALEGRRMSTPGAAWTGVRGTARVPLGRLFTASTELELVAPDNARGRGAVWPWGLVALRFRPVPRWELAGAFEASASPSAVSALSGLLRAAYAWGSEPAHRAGPRTATAKEGSQPPTVREGSPR